MLQGEKIPSRKELGDGDDQQGDAGRNGMRRVVREMGDCGVAKVLWLAANENASCVLCLLARDSQSEV